MADTSTTTASPDLGYDPKTGYTTKMGDITVYQYDSYGCLASTTTAYLNIGQLPPSNGTFIAPPAYEAGKTVPVFNTTRNTWSLEEDHRGQTVYTKADRSGFVWSSAGPIPDTYTTMAPATAYDTWDATQGHWVTDNEALHKALKEQALALWNGTINSTVSFFSSVLGMPLGPQYEAYRTAIGKIAFGVDKTSTSLPAAPSDPTL